MNLDDQKVFKMWGVLMNRPWPLWDGHQCALCFLRLDIGSESLNQCIGQLSPISVWMSASLFVPHVPLMRRFVQEGHKVHDLLGVTTSNEGQIGMHQGCPRMNILCGMPKEERRFFRLLGGHAKNFRGWHNVGSVGQVGKSWGTPTITRMGRVICHWDWSNWNYRGFRQDWRWGGTYYKINCWIWGSCSVGCSTCKGWPQVQYVEVWVHAQNSETFGKLCSYCLTNLFHHNGARGRATGSAGLETSLVFMPISRLSIVLIFLPENGEIYHPGSHVDWAMTSLVM